jgi:hypothetical protein
VLLLAFLAEFFGGLGLIACLLPVSRPSATGEATAVNIPAGARFGGGDRREGLRRVSLDRLLFNSLN